MQAMFRAVLTNMPTPDTTHSENTIMMDAGARVVKCRLHPKGVEIFFLANPEVPDEEKMPRHFILAMTGAPILASFEYIDTVGPIGYPALHVFQA